MPGCKNFLQPVFLIWKPARVNQCETAELHHWSCSIYLCVALAGAEPENRNGGGANLGVWGRSPPCSKILHFFAKIA